MAIDISKEHLLPLKDYPNYLPRRNGKRLSRNAGYRHAIRGVRGIKLETVQFPSGRYTSQEAIARFIEQLSSQVAPNQQPLPHQNCKSQRRQTQVEREIDEVRARIRKKGRK